VIRAAVPRRETEAFMARRSDLLPTWVLVVAAVALVTACTRQNPAFRGSGDGGVPPEDGAITGDVGPVPDGGCDPGSPCTAEGNRCQIGTTSCGGAGPACESLAPAPNGTRCGLDKVCKDGDCTECAAGSPCDPGVVCQVGGLDCSFATGDITCVETGPAPNSTPCADGVCYGGECASGTCGGLAGAVCETGKVCDRNGCGADVLGACVARPGGCTGTWDPVCGCDGTTFSNDCTRLVKGVALAHAGACAGATESCMNGVDDNGDGLIDCNDPQCQATHTCVEALPSGWTGLGWFDPDATPACSPGLTAQNLYLGMTAPPITCPCECGAAGAHCAIDLTCSPGGADCSGSPWTTTVATCGSVYMTAGVSGCRATEPHIMGACPGVNGTPVRPPVTWTTTGRACMAGAGGLCPAADRACVPRPPTGAIGPCIGKMGDSPCPIGSGYVNRHVKYVGEAVDSRTCTPCDACRVEGACSCTSGLEPCGVAVYGASTCAASSQLVSASPSEACSALAFSNSVNASAQVVGVIGPTGVTCSPPGPAAPSGSISPGPKVTVCCVQ
jgi:hypothetical protein